MKSSLLFTAILFFGYTSTLAQSELRSPQPKDYYRQTSVGDPRISPDGKWIVYTLSQVDSAKDKRNSDLWMMSWDAKDRFQLTHSPEGESRPRWSPDGKYLSFTATRSPVKGSQIYLMDRRGGEAFALTNLKSSLGEYSWSPDGKKIVMVVTDFLPSDTLEGKSTPVVVVDRYQFKQDYEGYVQSRRNHLYLLDVESKKIDTLTAGMQDHSSPVWSPDGKQLAFVSKRSGVDPDRDENTDIFIMEARKGAVARPLTSWTGSENNPVWSPDGKKIAYLRGSTARSEDVYSTQILSVIDVNGGEPVLLSSKLDREVMGQKWSLDGNFVYALVVDDRQQYIARFSLTGEMQKVVDGERVFTSVQPASGEEMLVIMSTPESPNDIYVLANGQTRRLYNHHADFLKPLKLNAAKGFSSKSKDGTEVHGIYYEAANAIAGKPSPFILLIHGGPVSQDDFSFDLESQILSGAGYTVALVNYRASNGRGEAYSRSVFGDWGNKEVIDLIGVTDHFVKQGIADPGRLGLGGWSYGGILTNYTIATTDRFKAAVSGAGSSLQLTMYGSDQYIVQYDYEIGYPWKSADKWMKVSYPFFKADKIKTPTLFMASEKDFNVPVAGSEQMYQALKTLGTPTKLIIYPGQHHGLSVPSYLADRMTRWLDWMGTYLK